MCENVGNLIVGSRKYLIIQEFSGFSRKPEFLEISGSPRLSSREIFFRRPKTNPISIFGFSYVSGVLVLQRLYFLFFFSTSSIYSILKYCTDDIIYHIVILYRWYDNDTNDPRLLEIIYLLRQDSTGIKSRRCMNLLSSFSIITNNTQGVSREPAGENCS